MELPAIYRNDAQARRVGQLLEELEGELAPFKITLNIHLGGRDAQIRTEEASLYLEEENHFAAFIHACCEEAEDAVCPIGDLGRAYRRYAEANAIPVMSYLRFARRIWTRGYKKMCRGGLVYAVGLSLRGDEDA